MSSVAVGNVFVDEGTLASGGPLLSVLDGGLDGEDVHTVDLQTRDVLSTLVVVGESGRAVSSGTHTVLVVCALSANLTLELEYNVRTLATEDDGQVPELGHVEGLEDLTLVGSTVTVEGKGDVLLVLVLACKGNASADGNLSTNDTVSTVEAGSEHVHRSTLSVCDTLSPAEQFTDDGLDGCAAHQSEAVAAVSGDEMIGTFDGVLDADGDGFLARGKMAETADLLLLVEPVGGHFHASVPQIRSTILTIDAVKRIIRTVQRPCRSTSSSAPSW
jgi:hypothetical protein